MSISTDQSKINEAMKLRASGKTNQQIADTMGVSPRTVGRLIQAGSNQGTKPVAVTTTVKVVTSKTAVDPAITSRNATIIALSARKFTNAQIAASTGVSPRTVGRVLAEAKSTPAPTPAPVVKRLDPKPVPTPVAPVQPDPAPVNETKQVTTNTEYDYLITGSSATVIRLVNGDSTTFQINKTHPKFKEVLAMILAGSYEDAITEIDKKELLKKYTVGLLTIENNQVKYAGKVLNNKLTNRLLDDINSGGTFHKHLGSFMDRAMNNVSEKSVSELWDFIEHNDIQLTENGMLIGWKKVTKCDNGYVDSYTKKIPNNLGTTVHMPRSLVNDNRSQTCSQGLHVGAWTYVPSFSGDTILRVIVDPADVVSVPSDYNGAKMRASRYYIDAIVDHAKKVVKLAEKTGVVIKAGPGGVWVQE